MAWTTPKTWTVNEVLTAADMNAQLRDNLTFLRDRPTFHYHYNVTLSINTAGVWTAYPYNTTDWSTPEVTLAANQTDFTFARTGIWCITLKVLFGGINLATVYKRHYISWKNQTSGVWQFIGTGDPYNSLSAYDQGISVSHLVRIPNSTDIYQVQMQAAVVGTYVRHYAGLLYEDESPSVSGFWVRAL